MKPHTFRCACAALLGAVTAIQLSAAPAPHKVTLTDYLGTDWTNELIHEPLTFPAGALTRATALVKGADGKSVASQVSDVERHEDGSVRSMKVWFFANLPANGTNAFTILPGEKPYPGKGVVVEQKDGSITLTTRAPKPMGIRLLGGAKSFPWPQQLEDSLCPIQKLLMPSGRAVGAGRLNAPFRIQSYETKVVNDGPLFADVEIRYAFDVGYWTVKVRVVHGSPMIQVEEEFNTGHSGLKAKQFDRWFSFGLNEGGFKPTQGWFTGNGASAAFQDLAKLLFPKSWEQTGALPSSANHVATPVSGYTLKFDAERDDYHLTGWPSVIPQVGNFIRFVEPGGESIGFATLRIMGWRDPMAIRFHTNPKGELRVNLPLQKYTQDWSTDGFGDESPNYTGITLFVPRHTSRRSYGIMLTAAENESETRLESLTAASARLGAHPLDEVRRWVLDWPDPRAGEKWAAQPTEAGTKAVELMRGRTKLHHLAGNLATFSMGNHYTFSKGVFPEIAKVINDPAQITASQRRELRRLVAFEVYRQNSFESFPYGAGMHLNNPNMTVMACEARAKSASLIKDHPAFREWGTVTLALMREFFTRFTFPSGAPYENPHYTLGVTMGWAAIANEVLLEAGIGDAFDTELFRSSMRFVMNWLTPPDPRFLGHRLVLPLGNGSYQSVPPSFGESYAAYFKSRDPKLAAELQWFVNQTLPDDKKLRIVEDKQPELKSGWWKDYGVIFRHGFGTKHETLMHLLAGKCFGHYEMETDHMVYSIYAKGQPIHLSFGNGYFPMFNRPWLRNRISFGTHMIEAPERNRIEVTDASFSPQVEYFHAERETDQLLPYEGEYPMLNDKGLQWAAEENTRFAKTIEQWDSPDRFMPMTVWHRQMLFLKDADPKGPNYFVLRDNFSGVPTKETDLSLWFLAKQMTENAGVYHFDGQCDVDMDVFVATPAAGSFKPHTDKYGHVQQPYGRLVGFDPKYFPDGKLREDQLLLRVHQPPGNGYLVVLYPRLKENDPPAKFERLAESVVRVETPLSTDTVFADFKPVKFANDQLSFEGVAGAVRQFKSGKIAVVNSEGACEVKVAGKTVTGRGAFVVEIDGAAAKVTWRADGAEASIR